MALLSTLFGCSDKITGPDFETQENKVIDIIDVFRVDYLMPRNAVTKIDIVEVNKKEPKSYTIKDYKNLKYEKWLSHIQHDIDGGMWNYYRGNKRRERDIVAVLTASISINKTNKETSNLKNYIENIYQSYVKEHNNDQRANFPDSTDEEIGSWLIKSPEVEKTTISGKDVVTWLSINELMGWDMKFFAVPIDNHHYLNIKFTFDISAKSDEEVDRLEKLIPADIEKFMSNVVIRK